MLDDHSDVASSQRKGGALVVSLTGEIDLHHNRQVREALLEACETEPRRLVINLEDVRYIDSSGIGTLVEVFRRVRGYEGELRLCGMSERVHSVFEVTKLDHFFKICATEAEALAE
jgi:anti-anti-sigma factor